MTLVVLSLVLFRACTSVLGHDMIGEGRWWVQNLQQCDDADQNKLSFELTRKKLNRTHDCFSVEIEFDTQFDDRYGIEMTIYKEVDGGYKYYHYLQDDSACNFANKYAKESFLKILTLGGIDPAQCPIPVGSYKAEEFVFNYSELKDPFVYGSYEINCYILFGSERVSCVKFYAKFEENPKFDEDDD